MSDKDRKPVHPAYRVALWEWIAVSLAGVLGLIGGSWPIVAVAVALLVVLAILQFGADRVGDYLPLAGMVTVVVVTVLGAAAGSVHAQVSAIEFTGALAPPINGEVVVETGFNWLAAFAALVLAAMGLRWGPRIARSMRRMG